MHGNQGPSGRPSQADQAKAKLFMTAKQAPETTHHPTEVLQEQGTWLQSHRALRQETSHRFPIQEKQTPFLQAERESRFEQYPEAGQSSLWVPEAPEPKPPQLPPQKPSPSGTEGNPESKGGTIGSLLCTEHRLGARPSTSTQASSHAKAGLCPLLIVRIVRKCLAWSPSPW